MSQIETTQATPPKTLEGGSRLGRVLGRLRARVEHVLRTFEWTWTNAVIFSVGFTFFILITTSVMPSFWLYYADAELRWDGAAPQELLWVIEAPGQTLLYLRDAVAMGLATGPIITVLILASVLQNWRRKLRGQTDSRPTGGYR